MKNWVEMATFGVKLAAEIAGGIMEAIENGDDIEPIVSSLPSRAQRNARRLLEDQETLKLLREKRREILGESLGESLGEDEETS